MIGRLSKVIDELIKFQKNVYPLSVNQASCRLLFRWQSTCDSFNNFGIELLQVLCCVYVSWLHHTTTPTPISLPSRQVLCYLLGRE